MSSSSCTTFPQLSLNSVYPVFNQCVADIKRSGHIRNPCAEWSSTYISSGYANKSCSTNALTQSCNTKRNQMTDAQISNLCNVLINVEMDILKRL